jgi:hypothetical protein
VRRVVGANSIRKYIQQNNTQDLFTVPQKWIYLIPRTGASETAKSCLLVAQNVEDRLRYKENKKKWKSKSVPQATLKALYQMMNDLGLSDSVYPSNVQFTKEGQISFLDTECAYWWPTPPRFHILGDYLSDENKAYWLTLCED